MAAWRTIVFSARQLAWLTLTVVASGVLLLVPVFVSGHIARTPVTAWLRALHSASSLLLVVGSLGHAGARLLGHAPTRKGIATGIATSSAVGLAVLSGAVLVSPEPFAGPLGVGADALRHAAAIFHYGYAAALVFGLLLWHLRPSAGDLLPRPGPGTWIDALLVPALGASLALPWAGSPYTAVLVPTALGLAAWTLLLPQAGWIGLLRRREPHGPPDVVPPRSPPNQGP